MAANSSFRKLLKSVLYPLFNEKTYKYFQAASKAWDIKRGSWTEPEIELLEIGLREGETTIDIGGNYGLYAYHMSRIVGKTGKVYSFEPVPFTFESSRIVSKMLGSSHNLTLFNKGCSNKNERVVFTIPVQKSGAFAAGMTYIGGRNDDRPGKEVQVRWDETLDIEGQVVRLDDFLPPIDDLPMVKIDIEGAELFCLEGAEKIFSQHLPTTICEINPWYLEGFGVETKDLIKFFADRDYNVFTYVNVEGRKALRPVEVDRIVEDNYVFLHPTRFERFAALLPHTASL